MRKIVACLTFVAFLVPIGARAEVTRVEVTSRAALSYAGYEKIVGRVYFAVDPAGPRNTVILDLDKAPRNAAGRVEFSADFSIIRPTAGGNGVAIVDIVNRGGVTLIPALNRGGGPDPDVRDAFLMRRGFAVVTVGWEFDLGPAGDLIRIDVPAATDGARPITGVVRAMFTPDQPGPARVGDLVAYPAVDPGGPDSALTVRDDFAGAAQAVARARWTLDGATVTMAGGFEPGRIYEIAYRAANPPVGGLGFAAVRDMASWMKYTAGALSPAKHVYAFGQSQSGRFLRDFLYHGFNADERDRLVFDGVMAHIAGAARIDLNRRWSTPITNTSFVGAFPFADRAHADPIGGVSEGLLENARAGRHQPKLFLTNSSVEYWIDVGRAAALVHTSPDGARDIPLGDNVRSYLFASAQHGPGRFPPAEGVGQQLSNPLDYWWSARALLVALDRWVREGTPPPPSRHPRLADGSLVPPSRVAFPAIPGVPSPRAVPPGRRVANPLVAGGGAAGAVQPLLVPQVDADGNDLAGIRLPDVVAPLATYTGWNFRNTAVGGAHRLAGNTGAYIPFARTAAERKERGDPRRSVEERYGSRGVYLAAIREAAAALVAERYLLAEDVDTIVGRASAHWDLVTGAGASSRSSR